MVPPVMPQVIPILSEQVHLCQSLCLYLALQKSSPATGHPHLRHNRATRIYPASRPWLSPCSAVGGP